jgi:chromosome segregation ATPase
MTDLSSLLGDFSALANNLEAEIEDQREVIDRIAQVRANILAISASRNVRYADDPDSQAELDDRIEDERAELAELIPRLAQIAANINAIRASLAEASNALRNATIGGKTMSQDAETKLFYDPQDDDDRERLNERLEDIERRMLRALASDDTFELEDIAAELRDLHDGLTDDTRFRVEELQRRLEDKSAPPAAPGAHAIYG